MFPSSTHSSGDLCGGERGVVEVWASNGRHNPEEEAEGMARTLSAPAICVAVVEVRREGSRGSTGFLSSFSAWSPFGEAVVFFLRFSFFRLWFSLFIWRGI